MLERMRSCSGDCWLCRGGIALRFGRGVLRGIEWLDRRRILFDLLFVSMVVFLGLKRVCRPGHALYPVSRDWYKALGGGI
jgi:hypothetical protein